MTGGALPPLLLASAAAALAGLVLGAAYFRALRATADLIGNGRGWLVPAALTVARIAAAGAALAALARYGGVLPLLAGFLGFLAARAIALHSARRPG